MADNTYLQKGLEVHLSDVNVLELVSLHFILIFPISCPCFFYQERLCGAERSHWQKWWAWRWWICLWQVHRLSWRENLGRKQVSHGLVESPLGIRVCLSFIPEEVYHFLFRLSWELRFRFSFLAIKVSRNPFLPKLLKSDAKGRGHNHIIVKTNHHLWVIFTIPPKHFPLIPLEFPFWKTHLQ